MTLFASNPPGSIVTYHYDAISVSWNQDTKTNQVNLASAIEIAINLI